MRNFIFRERNASANVSVSTGYVENIRTCVAAPIFQFFLVIMSIKYVGHLYKNSKEIKFSS